MTIPKKQTVGTRDQLAMRLGVSVRTVAHWMAQGCPGTPQFYVVEDVIAWRDKQAELRKQTRRRRRSGGGLNPR